MDQAATVSVAPRPSAHSDGARTPPGQSPAPAKAGERQVPTPSSSDSGQALKPNACISCQRRKVKCDRLEPCSACKRYRAQCEFREPAPRRKRKLSDEDLHAKLDRYESILNSFGARVGPGPEPAAAARPAPAALPIQASASAPAPTPSNALRSPPRRDDGHPSSSHEALPARPAEENGRLIFEKGSSRYLENNLWKGISDEFKSPGDMLRLPAVAGAPAANVPAQAPALVASELVLGLVQNQSGGLRDLHPRPPHIFLLWQAFLDNVNPLLKIIHAPTVQRQILRAATDLDAIDSGTEALMFAIYTFAVVSLSSDECQSTFGEGKAGLLPRFQHGTKLALHRAEFLRSSQLVVLQAYVLYLLAMRPYYDIQTLWSLSAVAVRMAQRIGLHRDGSKMGLPLFDIEIRRRVWWQLMPLDMRAAELAGGTSSMPSRTWDVELPLNCNDSDLDPDMKQLPIEHKGPTEMFFCNMRYNVAKFMKRLSAGSNLEIRVWPDDVASALTGDSGSSLADKDRRIEALEAHLEENFLQHCDPSVPLHRLSTVAARCAVHMMRLIAHHPRRYSDRGSSMPQSERDLLFGTALAMIELDNLVHADAALHRFLWHVDAFFQWEAFIYLVSELRARTSPSRDPDVARAWRPVNSALEHHPDLVDPHRSPLHLAVASLAAKAWDARVAEATRSRAGPESSSSSSSSSSTSSLPPLPDAREYPALEALLSKLRERSPAEQPSSTAPQQRQQQQQQLHHHHHHHHHHHQHQQEQQSSWTTQWPTKQQGGLAAGSVQNGGVRMDEWGAALLSGLDASPLDWDVWDDMLAAFGSGDGGSWQLHGVE